MVEDSEFSITLSNAAAQNFRNLPTSFQQQILDALNKYLKQRPYLVTKTRIKVLQGFQPTMYRLRSGDYRIYYRIYQRSVLVLNIMHKKDSDRWIKSVL